MTKKLILIRGTRSEYSYLWSQIKLADLTVLRKTFGIFITFQTTEKEAIETIERFNKKPNWEIIYDSGDKIIEREILKDVIDVLGKKKVYLIDFDDEITENMMSLSEVTKFLPSGIIYLNYEEARESYVKKTREEVEHLEEKLKYKRGKLIKYEKSRDRFKKLKEKRGEINDQIS